MMKITQEQILWTADDYVDRLKHPSLFVQRWAERHIKEEYPELIPSTFHALVDSDDKHLRVEAYKAMANRSDPADEEKLLRAFAKTKNENEMLWISRALAKRQVDSFWPTVQKQIKQINLKNPSKSSARIPYLGVAGLYQRSEAEELLWSIAEQYTFYDQVMAEIFDGLLEHCKADTIPRLLQRAATLLYNPKANFRKPILRIANLVDLNNCANNARTYILEDESVASGFESVESWLGGTLPLPREAIKSLDDTDSRSLFAFCTAEFTKVSAERSDDTEQWQADWEAGIKPDGYQLRALLTKQVLITLAEIYGKLDPGDISESFNLDAEAIAITLLCSYLFDQNDEKLLANAEDGAATRTILLEMLTMPRQSTSDFVMRKLADQGPEIVPELIKIIESGEDSFWPLQKSLAAMTVIARAHSRSCDAAIEPILNLLTNGNSDYTNEAAEEALRAIGPSVPAKAGPRLAALDEGEYTFRIFILAALSRIPTQESQAIVEEYTRKQDAIDEGEWSALESLAQPASIDLLQRFDSEGQHRHWPHVVQAMYTIALVNNLDLPNLDELERIALQEEERLRNIMESRFTMNMLNNFLGVTPDDEGQTEKKSEAQVEKKRKQKRTQAKAAKKAQRKQKKKKRKKR